jgi:hypothetical protein
MKVAPKPSFGEDAISVEALDGEIMAVYIRGRKTVDTSFGEKEVTFATILTPDSKEPLHGALFQSYFQTLEPGEWYVGRLEKSKIGKFRAWILSSENLPKAQIDKLEKLAEKWTPSGDSVPAARPSKPKAKKTVNADDGGDDDVPF